MGTQTLTLINYIVQFILIALVIYSGYRAKYKRDLQRHCLHMRVGVGILIVTMAVVMLPSLLGYTGSRIPLSWFYIELWVHHLLGLAVLGIFVYANLALGGVIKMKHRLLVPMRAVAIIWIISFIMGVHLYLVIWV